MHENVSCLTCYLCVQACQIISFIQNTHPFDDIMQKGIPCILSF